MLPKLSMSDADSRVSPSIIAAMASASGLCASPPAMVGKFDLSKEYSTVVPGVSVGSGAKSPQPPSARASASMSRIGISLFIYVLRFPV